MRMPTGALLANGAFLMAGQLAWCLRAWLSLLALPKETTRWEWKWFRQSFVYHRDVGSITNVGTPNPASISTIAQFSYPFDGVGNRMGQTALGRYKTVVTEVQPLLHDMGYVYDGLHRLTTATYTNLGSAQEIFRYDRVGNRGGNSPGGPTGYEDSRPGAPAATIAYGANNKANEYTTIDEGAGSLTVGYDMAGNLAKDEDGFAMEYDADNQLKTVFLDANANGTYDLLIDTPVAEYAYDALGRRIEFNNDFDGSGIYCSPLPCVVPVTTRYVHDGQNVIAEYDHTGDRQRYYVHGTSYIDERAVLHDEAGSANADYYYVLKDLYTVVGLVNRQGHEVERYTYDAYGQVAVTSVLTADVNYDGKVNGGDRSVIVGAWTSLQDVCQAGPILDLAPDGDIDGADRSVVVGQWTSPNNVNMNIPASAVGNPYAFTGRAADVFVDSHGDDTGRKQVQHNRERYYDSEHGRFLQRDPLDYVGEVDLYDYAKQSPVRWVDPRGESAESPPDSAPATKPAAPPRDNLDPATYLGSLLVGHKTICGIYIVREVNQVGLKGIGHTSIVWGSDALGYTSGNTAWSDQRPVDLINRNKATVSIYTVRYKPFTTLASRAGHVYTKHAYRAGPKKGNCCPDTPNCVDIIGCLKAQINQPHGFSERPNTFDGPNCNSFARIGLGRCCLVKGDLILDRYTWTWTEWESHNLRGWNVGGPDLQPCD